jgi:1-acyl-sn-glycerol-3-phosphate acyltransferase
VARWSLRVYFRRIVLSGRLSLPPAGPLILAANHPNSLVDALAMGWACHRPVHFLARSGLFDNPLAARFFRAGGAIPVYRSKDAPSDPSHTARNAETFREAHRLLREGSVLGIFPEGVSHEDLGVRQLKTGIARIAFEVEQEQDWSLGVRISPIGLNFSDRTMFRSDLFIRVGEPIEVRAWRHAYLADPKEAVRALVDEVAGRLEALVVVAPGSEAAALLEDIEQVF